MKKLLLSTAIVASLFTITQAEEAEKQAGAASGEITFEGTITEAGCTLLPVKNVQLGSMSVSAIKKGNGAWGDSKIEFVDCNLPIDGKAVDKPVKNITLTIPAGTADETKTDLWRSMGSAEKVGVEIMINGKSIKPTGVTGDEISGTIDTVSNRLTFPVQGRMVNTSEEGITAGTVRTTINFIANYK